MQQAVEIKSTGILLDYQNRVVKACETNEVVVIEKSRRIGISWTLSYFALMQAAAGENVYYLGYNHDMTRDFIADAEKWARALEFAVGRSDVFLDSSDADAVQALKIKTNNGAKVHALTSKPRSLRGKQGIVIIDEAAFHDDLDAVMQAALPLLMLGGKVIVLSTHLGITNPFNKLCEDIRQGLKGYTLIKITFADAIADGYYRDVVCGRKKIHYSKRAEEEYVRNIRLKQANPDQELDCIPSRSTGSYLPRVLLESRTLSNVPICRWQQSEDFMYLPTEIKTRTAEAWAMAESATVNWGKYTRYAIGVDIGRHHDLTVVYIVGIKRNLVRETVCVIELAKMPYDQQSEIMAVFLRTLPRPFTLNIDKSGAGDAVFEQLQNEFGGFIKAIALNLVFYNREFPRLKGALESEMFFVPKDDLIIQDYEQVVLIDGVPRIPKKTGQSGRHADAAIAGLLAFTASTNTPFTMEFFTTPDGARET